MSVQNTRHMRLIRNIKRYLLRHRFVKHGFSEYNAGEFGKYYKKPFSNVVLFIPEK